ncbi:MAG TPA: hypothetical protein VFL14_12440 [Xanthomonadales bacterium]|nr:hypothetical protein [Xanthomonadales bacterium]
MRPSLFVALLLACCLLPTGASLAQDEEQLSDCWGRDRAKARACRLMVAAVYHAMQYAQAERGLERESCGYGKDVDDVAARLKDDLLAVRVRNPSLPTLGVVVTTLSTSRACERGLATSYGGPTTGWLLKTCERGLKDDDEMRACAAYLGATFETLNLASAWHGADAFVCAPETGVKGKRLLELLIDATIADMPLQTRPAVEGVAVSVAKEFPCR